MASATVMIVWHESVTRAVGTEAYRTLLQFFLVAVVGGAVSLLYQAFNRQAEMRAKRAQHDEDRAVAVRETRQRYLGELISLYNSVKKSRRLLRAHAIVHEPATGGGRVRLAKYDELLQIVLDAQLSLETLARNLRAEGGLFATETGLVSSVTTAEAYLRELITEFETIMPTVPPGSSDLPTPPRLADFIGPYVEANPFRNQFVHPVQAAMAAIERLIAQAAPPP
jgi:hypothetical protein